MYWTICSTKGGELRIGKQVNTDSWKYNLTFFLAATGAITFTNNSRMLKEFLELKLLV